ncbi:MAG: magnesium-translocating P-type ATPase [Thermoanaerobaculia bacterium]
MNGLTSAEARERLAAAGRNELRGEEELSRGRVLAAQFRSPLLLLLVFAAVIAAATGEWLDAIIVMAIVLASAGLGFAREYRAQAAAAALRSRIRTRATVVRDGRSQSVPVDEVVPGDLVLLSAGSIVPADATLLEAYDFFVSEAVLTGESFPVEKAEGAPVFLGTNVRSGTGRCVVVATGRDTAFGKIAHRLTLRPPETEFDRGIRHFGLLLTVAMLAMILVVFAAHVLRGRPAAETLLFAIALAVGLSPELLPAILSVNLSRGAAMMSRRGVLVRHLNAIENLGSMDVLCTDKTGTLTRGVVEVEGAFDAEGAASDEVLDLAAINAALETGVANPLDDAILEARKPDLASITKLAEIPFDFTRKRVSVVVRTPHGIRLITKGAVPHVLEVCRPLSSRASREGPGRVAHEVGAGRPAHTGPSLDARDDGLGVAARVAEWSRCGMRVIAVAHRDLAGQASYGRADERDLTLAGFVTFLDEPKPGVAKALADLAALGVAVKIITGDTKLVAQHIARRVGLDAERVLTGDELDALHDEALWHAAERTGIFAEVDPNQKERIILALKRTGHVVGFLGDGVNDAPAMHAADTSLSVEQAVDVARQVADFVLLECDLDVIRGGIEEGRKTFANTLKYVLTTTSANLGNMVSMAAASLFLPFLPLTAGQILLNNFLSDVPAIGIADDAVDRELVDRPRRWDMRFIARFMIEFGALSSLFDLLTFALLLRVFRAPAASFRTAWFVESLLTELVIALVVRTRRPFFRSRPGSVLLWSTVALLVLAFAVPYLPWVEVVGFVSLPASVMVSLALIAGAYVLAAEVAKGWFYRTDRTERTNGTMGLPPSGFTRRCGSDRRRS